MKKSRIVTFVISLSVALSACSGNVVLKQENKQVLPEQSTINEQAEDYTLLYGDTLNSIYRFILNEENEEDMTHIREAALALGDEAVNKIGYRFSDLTGDDIPELIIGLSDKPESAYTKNEIYAVYTLKDNIPVLALEGRSRSAYSLTENNGFFYHGSNGAAYSIFGEYHLSDNAALVCDNYYFTYPDAENPAEMEIFYNTTGKWDKETSDKTDMNLDEFLAKEEKMAQKTINIEFMSFAEMNIT